MTGLVTVSQIISCGRCERPITCHADVISQCPCTQISLSSGTLKFLKSTSYNCLCNQCLVEVENMVNKAKSDHFPQLGEPLIEDTHYYLEGHLYVFTEYYHLLRGHCCKSGCRHCAYGFNSDPSGS